MHAPPNLQHKGGSPTGLGHPVQNKLTPSGSSLCPEGFNRFLNQRCRKPDHPGAVVYMGTRSLKWIKEIDTIHAHPCVFQHRQCGLTDPLHLDRTQPSSELRSSDSPVSLRSILHYGLLSSCAEDFSVRALSQVRQLRSRPRGNATLISAQDKTTCPIICRF